MNRAKAIPETITIHVPFRLVKRGGRKEMIMPPGAPAQCKTDNTLVKALARAFRWKKMLERVLFRLKHILRAEGNFYILPG